MQSIWESYSVFLANHGGDSGSGGYVVNFLQGFAIVGVNKGGGCIEERSSTNCSCSLAYINNNLSTNLVRSHTEILWKLELLSTIFEYFYFKCSDYHSGSTVRGVCGTKMKCDPSRHRIKQHAKSVLHAHANLPSHTKFLVPEWRRSVFHFFPKIYKGPRRLHALHKHDKYGPLPSVYIFYRPGE